MRLLGVTLLALAAEDMIDGWWHVHTGAFYPWRHLPVVPLCGPTGLVLEWLALGVAGGLLVLDRARVPAAWLGAAALVAGLTQRYSNQRALAMILFVYLLTDVRRPDLVLVRWQLGIVYAFSVLHKLSQSFWDGRALGALGLPAPSLLAIVTLIAEAAIPLVLWRAPRAGVAAVVLLHGAFALVLPGVVPFTIAMIAMSTAWLPERAAQAS